MRTKGGEFLIKATEAKNIFTVKDFSEEEQMMADTTSDFVNKSIWPYKARLEKKDYDYTLQIMKELGQLGLLAPAISQHYGGLGMGFATSLLICDRISGASGSISTAYGAHTGIGILPIFLYGNEQQKNAYLPKMVTGEWMGAYCLTEPGAGSDANSGKTSATLASDGSHYLINGGKMWISNAGFANIFIVFARIGEDKNITGFIVENDPNNGISTGAEEHKLGIRSSSTRQVFFNNTKVPIANVLGEKGNGFKIALNALNVGRIKLAAGCLDAQRRTISESIKYANQRIQFKVPISSFESMQEKLADMAILCFVSEAATYRGAKDIEQAIEELKKTGIAEQEAELKGVEEYATEASIMKVFVSEAVQYVTDQGIQIFGGMGFSEETPMESAWRDARITRIYEGTNEINRMLAVSMLMRKAMKGELDLFTPAKQVGQELMGLPSFEMPDYTVPFTFEKAMIANLKKAILMIAGKAALSFGSELEKHQAIVTRIADMMIETYIAESALLVAEKHQTKGDKQAEIYLSMAQINLFNAVAKVEKAGKEAILTMVKEDEQKVMLMGMKRFTKYAQLPDVIGLRKKIAAKLIAEEKYCF